MTGRPKNPVKETLYSSVLTTELQDRFVVGNDSVIYCYNVMWRGPVTESIAAVGMMACIF